MKKKVVHITTVHNAQDARIFFRQCCSLAKHFDTHLIAPAKQDFELDGVNIHAIGENRGRLHRVLVKQIRALWTAFRIKADLYHFHDPELILTGLCLKLLGRKVIYDVHEDVPKDILLKTHIPTVLRRPLALMANFMENLAAKYCDAIITVTPDIARRFPPHKTVLVRNYPFQILPAATYQAYLAREIDLIYIGSITLNRGLTQMTTAAKEINKNFVMIGNASPTLISEYLQADKYVKHIPWMPSNQLLTNLANSKVGLVVLHPTPTFLTSYPLKLFEYMAAGIPVIAANFPEWEEIINRYQCGLVVDPLDEEAIKQAMLYLLNNPEKAYQMGQNGLKAVMGELNWEREFRALLSVYNKEWKDNTISLRLEN
ncbi:glycosyltransferase family 4 protein [Legionella sp. W05-934-2]|uniref:glycosyltransferase family 4 protein n=1 Tax=Legionella sp. W05-934-2 TaxID=1198649 RepID=UPI003461842A